MGLCKMQYRVNTVAILQNNDTYFYLTCSMGPSIVPMGFFWRKLSRQLTVPLSLQDCPVLRLRCTVSQKFMLHETLKSQRGCQATVKNKKYILLCV